MWAKRGGKTFLRNIVQYIYIYIMVIFHAVLFKPSAPEHGADDHQQVYIKHSDLQKELVCGYMRYHQSQQRDTF